MHGRLKLQPYAGFAGDQIATSRRTRWRSYLAGGAPPLPTLKRLWREYDRQQGLEVRLGGIDRVAYASEAEPPDEQVKQIATVRAERLAKIDDLEQALHGYFDFAVTRGSTLQGKWQEKAATLLGCYRVVVEKASPSRTGPAARFVQSALKRIGRDDRVYELANIEKAVRETLKKTTIEKYLRP